MSITIDLTEEATVEVREGTSQNPRSPSVNVSGASRVMTNSHKLLGVSEDSGSVESVVSHVGLDSQGYDAIYLYSALLDDLERTRISLSNTSDSYGELTILSDELSIGVGVVSKLEHEVELKLCKAVRHHPLGAFVKQQVGVGEKQFGRLLGEIGDPLSYLDHDGNKQHRTVRTLWAYCGLNVVDGKAARIDFYKFNMKARSRARLIAESCLRTRYDSPYKVFYYAERERSADLPPGHSHNRALRRIAKEMLKDLWVFANELNPEPTSRPIEPGHLRAGVKS